MQYLYIDHSRCKSVGYGSKQRALWPGCRGVQTRTLAKYEREHRVKIGEQILTMFRARHSLILTSTDTYDQTFGMGLHTCPGKRELLKDITRSARR